MSEVLFTEKQAAEYLNLSQRALQSWRYSGRGMPFIRISHRCIRYRKSDIDEWLDSRAAKNTSQN